MASKKRIPALLIAAGLVIFVSASFVSAWYGPGHARATTLALKSLEGRVPEFFTTGARAASHTAFDPDLFRPRQLPQLRSSEGPEHYLDLELLEGRALPDTRYEFYKLCYENKIDPAAVGTLPYAVTEWTQKLAVAFAEHRKWPEDEIIRAKCLIYAGFIAHYAQDMCQPLHLTVHYDGRLGADGKSPRSGIHEKVDGLFQKLAMPDEKLLEGIEPAAFGNLMEQIRREIELGHALVDRVYELEGRLPGANEPITDEQVQAFAADRMRAAVKLTASLYLTAWEISADEKLLPPWHER